MARQRWRMYTLCALGGATAALLVAWIVAAAPRRTAEGAARRVDALRSPPQAFDWARQPAAEFPIPPYARHLKGVRIVLDPGHVGVKDPGNGWKRGPTGLREPEVNLRVANYLKEFLDAVGAEVTLTRERDNGLEISEAEDLAARAEVANKLRADLLLSIHHNAGPPEANYTTVFYHGSADHSPASVAAGRFVLAGLNDALRLDKQLENGLVSDLNIYKTDGFGVLRAAQVPAVLSEASFHTHPAEEQRLRDPLYNRREAYGLFLGLARWAQAGLPRVTLAEPADGRLQRGKSIVVTFDDGLSGRGGFGAAAGKVWTESLVVKVNGQPAKYTVNWPKREIRITPPSGGGDKPLRVYVDFTTITGQHVGQPYIDLER